MFLSLLPEFFENITGIKSAQDALQKSTVVMIFCTIYDVVVILSSFNLVLKEQPGKITLVIKIRDLSKHLRKSQTDLLYQMKKYKNSHY